MATNAQATAQPAAAGAANAPNSYKDATYDQLDAGTAQQLGLPSWLLPAIRTQGEKSNNDQVSDAGAQTVYQITPATRQLALKQYGIDPYLSASNASLVAGKLLQDSMDRNNGSVPQAVGEYIGGTNRSNWGKTTNAYISRVLQGAGGQSASVGTQANPYAANSASADATAAGVAGQLPNANGANLPKGPSIAKLVDAFNSGEMDQQAAADFQNDVNNGKVFLPTGTKLTRIVQGATPTQGLDANPQVVPIDAAEAANAQAQQGAQGGSNTPVSGQGSPQSPAQQASGGSTNPAQAAPQQVPLSVVQAYQSGQMDPQAKAEFEADVHAGKIALPTPQTPQEQGFLSQVGRQLGLFGRDALQAAGNTVGLAYDPLAATLNIATGSHINTAGSTAAQLADTLGLPKPQGNLEKTVNAATEAGLGGAMFAGGAGAASGANTVARAAGNAASAAGTAGAENAAARAITSQVTQPSGAVSQALSGMAAGPAAQTVASAAGGAAQQQAASHGAGPVVQTAANIAGALVAPARAGQFLARGAEAVGMKVAPGLTAKIAGIAADSDQPLRQAAQEVAQNIQNTPKDVAFDPVSGEITKEGRELSILSGLTPEGLRKAYGKLTTANEGNVQNETTAAGAAHGIDYTEGQATGSFATQDKEQTLVKSGTPEGDQARGFFDRQQQQINQAVDNFRAGFGDTQATPSERGATVQNALGAMRAQGQDGVRAMYKAAADIPGEAVPLEQQPIMDAAARVITELPTEESVKNSLQSVFAKYGLLGGEVTERGPFGNTVSTNGRSYQISGDMTPLSLSNAEQFRQALNKVYGADKTGHTGSVIAALDDSVENAVAGIAQRGNTTAPEIGQAMTHTPANGTATPVAYAGPGETADTARVTVAPPAAQTPQAMSAANVALATERDALAAQRAQTGAKATPLETALTGAGPAASARDRMKALQFAQDNNRPDIAQAVLSNARADAEGVAGATKPTNPAAMAVQQQAAAQLEKSAQALHDKAGVPYGASVEKTVPLNELSDNGRALGAKDGSHTLGDTVYTDLGGGYQPYKYGGTLYNPATNITEAHMLAGDGTLAGRVPLSEVKTLAQMTEVRKNAFEQARGSARQQKRTFEAKDVIQDLTSFKAGTQTPKVLPENTFTPLFNNPSNLRKAKNVLLANDPDGKGAAAWKAIQGQALAHIAEGARNPQSGDYSAERLNTAIGKFGDENLRTLFSDTGAYAQLKSLQAAIDKTRPLSGTVNYSNTFHKFANLVGTHLADGVATVGGAVGGVPGMLAGKGLGMIAEKIATQRKNSDVIKGIVRPAAPTSRAAQTQADKANQDLIDTLINAAHNNTFVPYGLTSDTDRNK